VKRECGGGWWAAEGRGGEVEGYPIRSSKVGLILIDIECVPMTRPADERGVVVTGGVWCVLLLLLWGVCLCVWVWGT